MIRKAIIFGYFVLNESTIPDVCPVEGCVSRNLMIEGDVVTENAPFVVALMQCTTSGGKTYCGKFCSGSLIAPDVVLTAGHCVREASSPFGVNSPPVALSTIYAMAGSVDIYNNPGPLRQAASLSNHGYGLNVRYTFDQDLALVFLSSCFDLVPGVIETIPVATLQTEPVWADATDNCASQEVRTYGFGLMSNLPSQLAKDNGKLKSITTLMHSPETCAVAYVAASFAGSGTDINILNLPQYSLVKEYYYSLFVAEYHLCAGGNRPDGGAACFGDSGGPVVSSVGGVDTVVGVTSFGASGYCGLGPDFSSRVASQADWIAGQLQGRSSGCSAPVPGTFSVWPPNSLATHSDSFTASRCSSSPGWQCDYGTCIYENEVCDGSPNCSSVDTSDEATDFCSASNRRLAASDKTPELDALIVKYLAGQPKTYDSWLTNFLVVVVGALNIDIPRVPSGDSSVVDPQARTSTTTPMATTVEQCAGVNDSLTQLISDENKAATNTRSTEKFQNACDIIAGCKVGQTSTYTCSTALDSFCTSMTSYSVHARAALTLALNFNATYSVACAVPWDGVLPTDAPTEVPVAKSVSFLSFSCLGDIVEVSLSGGRKLMINGSDIESISDAPFAVAIVQCSVSGSSYYCGKFCSGALIAPDVVLTAGHCTHDASSPFGVDDPPRPVSYLYIIAGTTDLFNGSATLVKVESVHSAGYALNVRYNMDNDVGLAFLTSCVALEPGRIETIPVATLTSEPDWTSGSCASRSVTTYGFGIKSNLPSEIAADDGLMRSVDSVVHSPEVCSQAYVDASMADIGYDSSLLDQPGYEDYKALYYSTVSAEYHLCSGGQDNTSTCFGDSGGPMVADVDGIKQIVGVTSFGVAQYCGLGPDFLQRTASHSQWIADTIAANGKLCVPVADAFAASISSLTDRDASRCLASEAPWQCMWGGCLATADVCNSSSDCSPGDASDEGSDFCSAVSGYRRLEERGPTLEDLIEAYKTSHPELPSRKSDGPSTVVIVGSLGDPDRVHNPMGDMPRPRPLAHKSSSYDCGTVNETLSQMIANDAGDNAAESDPTEFAALCTLEQNCLFSGSFTVDSTIDSFCMSFLEFVFQRDLAATLAAQFSTTYAETCLPGVTTTTSTTGSTTTTSSLSNSSTARTQSNSSTTTESGTEIPVLPDAKSSINLSVAISILIGLISI